ncbi:MULTISPECIES: FG-GAP-like repeat-containing protein [unclassified Streptomyces]|uniref:FG-GAP-like repeat-containing protein n=1 Tax=unclassified Streptomyces TaxID=2593676 RepID=UPI0036FFF3B5
MRGAFVLPLALGLSTTALAAPAGAATGADRCPVGRLCLFSEPQYQGEMLIVTQPRLSLGSWDNRVRSFVFEPEYVVPLPSVCLHPKPGLDPAGARRFYSSAPSLASSEYPELELAVSSIDIGQEASAYCGSETRHPRVHASKPRLAPVSAAGAFGDIDRDGYADVIARNPFGQLWSAHDPASARASRLVGGGWDAMTKLTRHGDQDGDELEDLYARDRAGVLWLYPGDGKGAFKPRRQVGGGWNSMTDLAAAGDLTGDGKGDLLASDVNGVLWTYPGTGRGGFATRGKVGEGWKTINELVGAGDMNADGKADLVARDTTGRLWLYPGNRRGTFTTRKLIGTSGWNAHKELLGLGDVTGDGHPDLIAHTTAPHDPFYPWLKVYSGTGDGNLRTPTRFAEGLRSDTFTF